MTCLPTRSIEETANKIVIINRDYDMGRIVKLCGGTPHLVHSLAGCLAEGR